jgi:hypothetical protein
MFCFKILIFALFKLKKNLLKSLQNKKGLKIFQLPTFRCFFSAASCRKRHRKVGSWKIFRPFLFCNDFRNILTTFLCKSHTFGHSYRTRNILTRFLCKSPTFGHNYSTTNILTIFVLQSPTFCHRF